MSQKVSNKLGYIFLEKIKRFYMFIQANETSALMKAASSRIWY